MTRALDTSAPDCLCSSVKQNKHLAFWGAEDNETKKKIAITMVVIKKYDGNESD